MPPNMHTVTPCVAISVTPYVGRHAMTTKTSKRATTREGRKAKKPETLPTRFEVRSLEELDKRTRVIREIKYRLKRLMDEAGCDSYQKELLAEQAVFIATHLQTMRVQALDTGEFDGNLFISMVNTLQGLLAKLGLKKQAKDACDLEAYLNRRGGDA